MSTPAPIRRSICIFVVLILSSACRCRTALHFAVQAGHIPVVDELVRLGSDLDAVDELENTGLHIAAALGNEGGFLCAAKFDEVGVVNVGVSSLNLIKADPGRNGESTRAARLQRAHR